MTGVLAVLVSSGGMVVTASPDSVSGFGTGTVSTGISSVTVVGGVAPFTYSWSYVDGDTGILPFNPSGSATAFYRNGVSDTDSFSANYICTVTDAGGVSANSNTVTANITGV